MTFRSLSGPRNAGRRATASAAGSLAVLMLVGLSGGPVRAQPAPASPPRPAAPAKPAAPRPAAPAAQQAPPAAQAAPVAPGAPGAAPAEMPKLVFSPWAKFCDKGTDPNAKQVCFTGTEARTEAGQPVVAAVLVEPEGQPKKLLRVTLPSPVLLQYGTRIIIDVEPAISAPFFTCFGNGCMADYEATPEIVTRLKAGKTLFVQAITLTNAPVSFPLPLGDSAGVGFQKANDGPPSDPKVLEAQRKKLEEEAKKRQ
jgi:invasion protein IalB